MVCEALRRLAVAKLANEKPGSDRVGARSRTVHLMTLIQTGRLNGFNPWDGPSPGSTTPTMCTPIPTNGSPGTTSTPWTGKGRGLRNQLILPGEVRSLASCAQHLRPPQTRARSLEKPPGNRPAHSC